MENMKKAYIFGSSLNTAQKLETCKKRLKCECFYDTKIFKCNILIVLFDKTVVQDKNITQNKAVHIIPEKEHAHRPTLSVLHV
jgi:hypothetical protein